MSTASTQWRPSPPGSELSAAAARCRTAFIGIALFSGMSNLLMLTGSFYMLEIYDRVIPSRSIASLIGITILAAGLFAFQAVIDVIRGRILSRIGASLDEALSARIYDTIVRMPLRAGQRVDGLQSLRDLDSVRMFFSGLGPTALFDLPWMPLYIAICFAFHPWLGITALLGAIVLVALTILTEMLTRAPIGAATSHALVRQRWAEVGRRNAEVITAMGMAARLLGRFSDSNQKYLASQQRASDVAGGFGSIGRVLRLMVQSAVLGVGAYLVIAQEASAGVIIAGAILTARALAPVDLAIANWRGFVAARQGWARLKRVLASFPATAAPMTLPRPSANLAVEQASAVPPGQQKVVAQNIQFALKAGNGLAIVGPSASGKSSLARLLVGVWLPARGKIRLDGASLDQWPAEELGRHIGYVPQDVELIAGSVAQNIARFDPDADSAAVIAAAQAAGVHDMIVKLGAGYDTDVGEQGSALSAGQQQRIALARALYGDPFLVVLDEPNSNLDGEGEAALTKAILGVRARGGIAVVVSHRSSVLAGVDHVLLMQQGQMQAFGPKDEVMKKLRRAPAPAAQSSLNVVADSGREAS